jgi:hypothetical protein
MYVIQRVLRSSVVNSTTNFVVDIYFITCKEKKHRDTYLEVMHSLMDCSLNLAFERHPAMHAYVYT